MQQAYVLSISLQVKSPQIGQQHNQHARDDSAPAADSTIETTAMHRESVLVQSYHQGRAAGRAIGETCRGAELGCQAKGGLGDCQGPFLCPRGRNVSQPAIFLSSAVERADCPDVGRGNGGEAGDGDGDGDEEGRAFMRIEGQTWAFTDVYVRSMKVGISSAEKQDRLRVNC